MQYSDDELLERIRSYSPRFGCDRVSLQLMGMLGHGKSSLINTCANVVQDTGFTNIAGSGQSDEPITLERKDYNLANKIVITDNRGIGKMTAEELLEISAQFSQLRDQSTVEWNRSFRENADHILRYFLSRKKEVIVPVCVYSSGDLVTEERYKELESFIREAHRITGIYPIIVLTKVKDNSKHAAVYSQRFRQLGAVHIYQIENYTTDQSVGVPETRREILKFLITCLEEADRRTSQNQMTDPQEEYVKNALEILGMMMKIETERLQEEKDKAYYKLWCEKEQMLKDLEYKEKQLNELRETMREKICIVM